MTNALDYFFSARFFNCMKFAKTFIYVLVFSGLVVSCNRSKRGKLPVEGSSTYDLNNPVSIELPSELDEISGIVYSAKDSSMFAITDEEGLLYNIDLNNKSVVRKWRFDKKRDFEELVYHDGIFNVLISNGDIESIKFGNEDSILITKSEFPAAGNNRNEFEAMYYDDSLQMLILLCKNCIGDVSKAITVWGFDISTQAYVILPFALDLDLIAEKLGVDRVKLRPSSAAINPVTNELYILSSINKLIIITDRVGKFIDLYQLDPSIFTQPEGIAFDKLGNLYISNEKGRGNYATVLQFLWKPKKNE